MRACVCARAGVRVWFVGCVHDLAYFNAHWKSGWSLLNCLSLLLIFQSLFASNAVASIWLLQTVMSNPPLLKRVLFEVEEGPAAILATAFGYCAILSPHFVGFV